MDITFKGTASALALAIMAGTGASVASADTVEIIYSDTVQETDRRSRLLKDHFGDCLGEGFTFTPYFGATLFKQGTELTALQRGNLDMANLAIFDFYNQVPATSILGTAYLWRDYEHMRATFDSDVLDGLIAEIEEKTGVKVLAWPYIGTRHVNIRGDKKIMTPEDLAGIKLRMPGGEGWQFVGEALGANPTPLAFTEVYTALQTGAIDGQDNPLPADKQMKFYEVTDQIILTGHLIASNTFSMSSQKWNSLDEAQQAKVQECALEFQAAMDEDTIRQEAELVDFFVSEGLDVYEPDKAAFRTHVLDVFKNSRFSVDWPEGVLEGINGL
ncbi:TRAP-type C4-dicarboxylate transport system, substrate-binding protein [Pseudooceanicola antarcticus]|uniref:C4-dicarboxylate ABC transporter n=1 Tax=Pseudooceanicola antarcticus TaxID=1247613 RepID=A0A285J096_9RHOB|nr:TRAP transporter substrate-binding protein DctP [Pseudooceanicola antarcticus]PJE25811.1 C4-dicarboxylate ABC transporter [Pseudooceanicola antarcticus]SNY52756.1 TRAP-type C4-dicarboxylate transport system, substrate-binding protein [Pseudooceanicola antarcticus]